MHVGNPHWTGFPSVGSYSCLMLGKAGYTILVYVAFLAQMMTLLVTTTPTFGEMLICSFSRLRSDDFLFPSSITSDDLHRLLKDF